MHISHAKTETADWPNRLNTRIVHCGSISYVTTTLKAIPGLVAFITGNERSGSGATMATTLFINHLAKCHQGKILLNFLYDSF